jgi:hypothetical protein
MARIVGTKDRSEFVADPQEAWRRARALDRMLPRRASHERSVQRASHEEFNRLDDLRALESARRLAGRGRS